MRRITRQRWNAFASYCRHPAAPLLFQELAWFESADGCVLATVVVDVDGDFLTTIFARDALGRFRSIGEDGPYEKAELATANLTGRVQQMLPALDVLRIQGDESGDAIDFFAPRVPDEKLNLRFQRLASGDDFAAARAIIGQMMRSYDDADGNFVEQFQTTGFDARLWELYLFAALSEAGCQVERPKPAPDLLARGIRGEFALEATTINPTVRAAGKPDPLTTLHICEDPASYVRHYLPIRYAGPLTSKLAKKYWTKPAAAGKPLALAIQDFHAPLSMRYSFPALPMYLYGITQTPRRDSANRLIIESSPIEDHRWEDKVVPSGFFSLPDAENISAVLFNNAGTLNKFNRMGVGAGFGVDGITLVRSGTLWDPNPDSSTPIPFEEVIAEGNPETWIEGMDVFHNPNAKHPLDDMHLPGAAHHHLLPHMQIETSCRGRKPMESGTEIRRNPDPRS
ncbi:hypothetical protein [Mycobacteroides franklinii]|uniref:Glycosaminoglycan attachment protein n=1 Tax=Mycobacteroides franklinii TaxID=948102 RepID=A0A4R5P630_9MYCO|nr:hypothetical protein [Mycobacteroides franklinii]ORA62084.1 hypothetical protein BST24_08015 [Mycobacteroides franklinii]TDH18886.1 hypothetical protein EJ571_20025 [Mycobacteroides franklinii]